MGLFGAKHRRTREIAHEVLKPLGVDVKDLTERSAREFTANMRRVVSQDQENDLYNRQAGWSKEDR